MLLRMRCIHALLTINYREHLLLDLSFSIAYDSPGMKRIVWFRIWLVGLAAFVFVASTVGAFFLALAMHPSRYGALERTLSQLSSRDDTPYVYGAYLMPWFSLAFIVVGAVVSASVIVLFWNRRAISRGKTITYFVVLAILMPISAINFASGDKLMAVEVEVLLDVAMVFLGTMAIILLLRASADPHEVIVLKFLAIAALALETVVIAGFYAVSFLLVLQGWGQKSSTIAGVVAVVGYIAAVIKYLAQQIKPQKSTKRFVRNRAYIAVLLVIGFYALSALVCALPIVMAYLTFSLNLSLKPLVYACLAAGTILWSLLPRDEHFVAPGPLLDPDRSPRLFEEIQEIAKRSGQEAPKSVYLTHDMNAWVSRRGGFMEVDTHQLMALGLPLMGTLSVSQFRAVLAHEFGHFSSGDATLAPWVYGTRKALARTIQNLARRRSQAAFLFVFYGKLFMRVTSSVSRTQELAADALAVRITGSKAALITGLQAIQETSWASQMYWESEVAPVLNAGLCPPLADGLARFLSNRWVESQSKSMLNQGGLGDPYDTHPTLEERIAELENMPDGDMPLSDAPATSLFEDLDEMEKLLAAFLIKAESPEALQSIPWTDVGSRVLLPIWRKEVAYQSRALKGLTLSQLPKALRGPYSIKAKLRDPPGIPLSYAQIDTQLSWVAGAALALALYDQGWKLRALPGQLELCHHRTIITPFSVVQSLHDGEMTDDQWLQLCTESGISDLSLGSEPLDSKGQS